MQTNASKQSRLLKSGDNQVPNKNINNKNNKLKCNITVEEKLALKELREEEDLIIINADKGRCTVLMDKDDYDKKMFNLLSDENTYTKLKKDPTITYKNKMIKILRSWVKENQDLKSLKQRIYPTSQVTPRAYGTPKIHKPDVPLRPIVAGIGSITYQAAKYLAEILGPLVGKTVHHIHNSSDFVKLISDITLEENDQIVSFDVTALFTSIPTPDALTVIRNKLTADLDLHKRRKLNIQH